MRVVGHELGVALGNLVDLLVHLALVDRHLLDGDGDRLVGRQLVVRLRREVQAELERLAALERRLGLGLRRERGDDADLVDGERHEGLDRLVHDDRVQILDAHALLGGLGHRLVLLGAHAHLLGEREVRVVERVAHLGRRGNGVDQQAAVVELLLSDFHLGSVSFLRALRRRAPDGGGNGVPTAMRYVQKPCTDVPLQYLASLQL